MYEDFYGWSLENVGKGTVETKYTVEYINDKKMWDRMCHTMDHYCEIDPKLRKEPWEFYDKREYENIAKALNFYMTWYVNESCYDIKLWERIYVNGELVLEQLIEPECTTMCSMRRSINREMEDRMRKAEEESVSYRKENKLYKGFISYLGERYQNMFNEYVKMEGNNGRQRVYQKNSR